MTLPDGDHWVGYETRRVRGREFRRKLSRRGEVGPWFEVPPDGRVAFLCDSPKHSGRRVRIMTTDLERAKPPPDWWVVELLGEARGTALMSSTTKRGLNLECHVCREKVSIRRAKALARLREHVTGTGASELTLNDIRRILNAGR